MLDNRVSLSASAVDELSDLGAKLEKGIDSLGTRVRTRQGGLGGPAAGTFAATGGRCSGCDDRVGATREGLSGTAGTVSSTECAGRVAHLESLEHPC